jgi:VanZ family protein
LLALLLYAAFVVYGSLVPLDYHPRPLQGAWLAFQRIPYLRLGVASRADWVANILLYVPLAFLGSATVATSVRTASGRLLGITFVVIACVLLAFGVEFAQLFFPPRTVSQNDLIAETIGTLLGAGIWLLFGRRLLALSQRLSWGGAHSWRALAALYGIGYLAYSLFPFDFLVTAAEWRAKLAQTGHLGWLLAGSCGGAVNCSVKLGAEVMLAAPLGALLGLAFPRIGFRFAFLLGCTLGFAIELMQMALASGISQGFSILTRGLGMAWGVALQHRFRVEWLTRHARLLRRALVFTFPFYVALLALLNGFAGKLDPLWVARQKLAETRFLPFYYHYFTSETVALANLLGQGGTYAVIGGAFWLAEPVRRRGGLAGSLAFVIAFAVEALKLFLPGKKPDPTNLLIAFAAAFIANTLLGLLTGSGAPPPAAAPGPSMAVPRNVRRWVFAGVATIAMILGGSLMVATPYTERPVDESTMPQLPPGHELPAVSLPGFNFAHPRLPHPSPDELVTLAFDNPAFMRNLRDQARGGKGSIEGSALLELIEPGSVDLGALHARLMALKFEGRGHEQGRPLALAYDWLHSRWSDSQRRQLQGKLVEGTEHIVKFIREERLSPYNVYLYNSPFQALMACALVLYGDDPRGEPAMRFTYDLWKNRVLPVWRQIMGRNGGWHEGGEYVGVGIGQAIYQLPAMWRSATGEDLFATEPGIRGFLDFLVYRTRPDGTHFRWGDGGYFDRIVPDAIPLALEFRHAAAYNLRPPAKAPAPSGWPWGRLTDAMLLDPSAASTLPLWRLFDGIGLIVARSDWSPNATYVTFKAGDNYWSHSHLDQGAFTIYKGGELAIDSGLYGPRYGSDHHLNYSYQTIAHNTITVTDPDDVVPMPAPSGEPPRPIANDGGQRRVGSGWGVEAAPLDLAEWQSKREIYHTGSIAEFVEKDGIVLASADVTPAYTNERSGKGTFSHRTRRVEQFWRTFGYDSVDDVVVVFDQVRATKASFRKRWLLHTIEAPGVAGKEFNVSATPQNRPGHQGGRLRGIVLLPSDAQINAVGGAGLEFFVDDKNYDEGGKLQAGIKGLGPARAEPGAWRIEVTPGRDATDDRFLVVLLPTGINARATHAVRLLEEGTRVGCEIVGPQRTTRWWFEIGKNHAEVQVVAATRLR